MTRLKELTAITIVSYIFIFSSFVSDTSYCGGTKKIYSSLSSAGNSFPLPENKAPNIIISKADNIAFSKSPNTLGNMRTFGVSIGDVNMDGNNDVFTTNYIGPCKLWLNNGSGSFTQSSQNFGNSQSHDAAIHDFNGDGFPDILLLNHSASSKLYFNNGSGIFTAGSQNIGSITDNPGMVVLGDVDNDGDTDLYISRYQLPGQLWLNDGKGYFTVKQTGFGGANGHSIALADVNGDKTLDLFLSLIDKPDEIWINDGKGNFTNSNQQLGDSKGYESVDCGDIDGDGDVDFVVSNSIHGIKIWLNQNNTGKFSESGPYFGSASNLCRLFDSEMDGDLDLITAHDQAGNLLWVNNGTGSFSNSGAVFGTMKVFAVECKDIDGDKAPDVVFGQLEGTTGNSIYLNKSIISDIYDKKNSILPKFSLFQNYPNPFNSTTTIRWQAEISGLTNLIIYDIIGRKVKTLLDEFRNPGSYEIDFESKELPSGIYFCQLKVNNYVSTIKVILMK